METEGTHTGNRYTVTIALTEAPAQLQDRNMTVILKTFTLPNTATTHTYTKP